MNHPSAFRYQDDPIRKGSPSKTRSYVSNNQGAHSNVTSIEEEDDIYIRPASASYEDNIEVANNLMGL